MPRDRKSYNKNLVREKQRVALTNPFNKGFRPKPKFTPEKPSPGTSPGSSANKPR